MNSKLSRQKQAALFTRRKFCREALLCKTSHLPWHIVYWELSVQANLMHIEEHSEVTNSFTYLSESMFNQKGTWWAGIKCSVPTRAYTHHSGTQKGLQTIAELLMINHEIGVSHLISWDNSYCWLLLFIWRKKTCLPVTPHTTARRKETRRALSVMHGKAKASENSN